MNSQNREREWKDGCPREVRRTPHLNSEKGMVLVVAMVMLVMLGMLGAYALNTSVTELHIAGNYRNEQIAFFNCNEAEAFGPNNQIIQQTIVPNVVNSYPTGTGFMEMTAMPAGSQGKIFYRVEYVCASPPSKDAPTDAEGVNYHFLVTIVGRGANSSSECVIESEVIQAMITKPQGLQYDCL